MTDLIVVLPGIGGSVLGDATRTWYGPSAGTLWQAVRHPSRTLEVLAGAGDLDDPDAPQPLRATGLIGLPVTVPGLASITSYDALRRRLMREFDLTTGDPGGGGPPANYFEFAYDWRRDNRVSAAQLRQLIERELPRWQATLTDGTAKVILIGHSMGGLVAKYYLDALDGWLTCRALLTFGTPFRGSVKALDVLANGIRKGGVEIGSLSQLLRGFSSVYQLLPRYPVVMDQRGAVLPTRPIRVTEVGHDIGGLSRHRAEHAHAEFHQRLDQPRSSHPHAPLHHLIDLVPVIGYGHPTLQSAVLDHANRLTCLSTPADPDERNPWHRSGDRTVPALSALPVELSGGLLGDLANDTHGVIHGGASVLDQLVHGLARYGANLEDLQHPPVSAGGPQWTPALGLDLADVFDADEPVEVRCSIPPELSDAPATVSLGGASPARVRVERGDDLLCWHAEGVPAGVHTVTVTVGDRTVSDVFEVG